MKKEKMCERLTELQVFELVKIYKEYDCLWDSHNQNYKNREVRDKAYQEIFDKVNIHGLKVTDIPQKIKNVRTSYYTELRKVENSIKSGGNVYRPKVAWFAIADEMLKKVAKNHLALNQKVDTDSDPEPNSITAKQDNTPKTISSTDVCPTSVTATTETPQIISTERSEPQTKYHRDDEFDSYGKYIAMSLRAMPRETSIEARLVLQRTIADIQLKVLKQKQQVTQSSSSGFSTSTMETDPLSGVLDRTVNTEVDFSVKEKEVEEG